MRRNIPGRIAGMLVLVFTLSMLGPGKLFAFQKEESNGAIAGAVTTADNKPAADVTVTIRGTNRQTLTNEKGNFIFHHIKPGNYTIEISLVSYEPITKEVVVENNSIVNFSLQLKIYSKELQEVIVTTNRSQNQQTTTIGKIPVETKDLPQAVTVIDKEILARQQVLTLGDAIENVNGVYVMGTTGGTQQEIGARGYIFGNSNTFKNGVLFNNSVMPEMTGVERVEFLKGSAALLLGNVTAGGVLNIVTKKPVFENGGEISMRMGSYDFYKPSLDIYGLLNDSKMIAYRVNASYEKERSFRDDVHAERFYINPSFLIEAGKKTKVLVEGDYLTDNRTLDYGVGTINFTINDIPRSRFLGVPWSYNKAQESSITVTTSHQFNDNWQLKNITGFYNYTYDLFGTTRPGDNGGFTMEENGNWVRGIQRSGVSEDYYSTEFDLTGKFNTGAIGHQLLIGAMGYIDKPSSISYSSLLIYDSINVFDLGKYPQRSDVPTLSAATQTYAPVDVFGLYVQDLVSITNKIKVLAGVRFNYEKTKSDVYTYSTEMHKVSTTGAHPVTPRLGIVYQPTKKISLFASYSNSFTLNTGVDTSGHALPPSFINQYEAGFKSDWFDRLLSFNFTTYIIVNSDLAQTSLANGNTNSNIKELAGQVTSSGLELDLATKNIDGFNLIGGYSYNDTRYTKSNSYKVGSPLQYAPQNTINASVYYTFNARGLSGFNLGLLAFYIGGMDAGKETRLTVPNDNRKLIPLPAFTEFDFTAGYTYKKIAVRIKVSNLFNAMGYYAHEDESINPIAPREFSTTLSLKL
ncbi:MAG TPA: TonB-dependent receptor [Puia sp.]|nr:TonB-dependent receptor [Puia sp.]